MRKTPQILEKSKILAEEKNKNLSFLVEYEKYLKEEERKKRRKKRKKKKERKEKRRR
jgi:hypothetical protein